MSQYLIHEGLFPRPLMLRVAGRLRAMHENREQRGIRWGFTLDYEGWLFEDLARLEWHAAKRFGCKAELVREWSTCRYARPDDEEGFRAHQDVAALGIVKDGDKGCVFWLPLEDLGEGMPVLAVLEDDAPLLPHVDDGRGVSIIDPAQVGLHWRFRVLDGLKLGDVVEMDGLCVHKTWRPGGCWKPRLSLDLRARPA